jgi:hypothetical protein
LSGSHPEAAPRWLGVAAALAVVYGGVCKGLLFHNLDYVGSDLFSFLDGTWSWYYTGQLLHDNVYGNHGAIHNFYLLLAFSPLTIPLGAYGFVVGLSLLHLIAALRIVGSRALDPARQWALLAGALSPVAFFAFDHRNWGFHPELCYAPLAVLFVLDVVEARPRRAIVTGLLVMLVKEDGAVLLASVLVAYFLERLWELRDGPAEARRATLSAAVRSLLAVTVAFAAGMAILVWPAHPPTPGQITASPRVLDSIRLVGQALAGEGDPQTHEWLLRGLSRYAVLGALVLLPLGRRFGRGAALLLASCPPLLAVLVISSAGYGFRHLAWPPRLATFLGLLLACIAVAAPASRAPADRLRVSPTAAAVFLIALSWGLQVLFLERGMRYSPWPRLNLVALAQERGYRLSTIAKDEVALVRCVAKRLPGGTPVLPHPGSHPIFHRQSIVFSGHEAVWQQARVRVVGASAAGAGERTPCRGPERGGLVVEAECSLLPLVTDCFDPRGRATVRSP